MKKKSLEFEQNVEKDTHCVSLQNSGKVHFKNIIDYNYRFKIQVLQNRAV